jgi:Zn-dependent protease
MDQPTPTPTRWLPPLQATEPPAPLGPAQGLPPRALWRRALAPLVRVAVAFKGLLLVLPGLKVLTTAGSMLVSVAAYSLIWGWTFAAGFVVLLFVHESGHAIQMRREGIRPSWMVFIPFLGAVVGARSLGGNATAEARIGLAGPVLGSLGAAAVLVVGLATNSDMLLALAYTGFFLNLFNLIPLVPFDGGRAMAAMTPWMWGVGFAAMLGLFIVSPNPLLVLFLLLGGMEGWSRFRRRRAGAEGNPAYYRVRAAHRLIIGAVYVGLIVALVAGMHVAYVDRSSHFS